MGEAAIKKTLRRSLPAPKAVGKCFYCEQTVYPRGSEGALAHPALMSTNDHYTPFAIGQGRHAVKVVIACQQCNSVKGSTPPHVFMYFVRNVEKGLGGQAFRAKYQHFCYLLMACGLKAAMALARNPAEEAEPIVVTLAPIRGRFTAKDLRRKA